MLQGFLSVSDHFGTLCMKGLKSLRMSVEDYFAYFDVFLVIRIMEINYRERQLNFSDYVLYSCYFGTCQNCHFCYFLNSVTKSCLSIIYIIWWYLLLQNDTDLVHLYC